MTASTGHSWTRSYEPHRNLITAVQNTYGPAIISRFDYANDEIGRRVSRADSGIAFDNPAFDVYAYNTRSEVIGAQRYHGTDVSDTSKVYGGRGFGYNYDPIGNRTSASETIGGETLVKSYTANALNQYTSIANPDAVGLRGSATNTATVTVNGSAASRDSIASDTVPWHYALPADNANGGAYTFAEIMAAVNPPGTNTPDIVSTASGNVYAPPRNETPTYDLDGNLLSDGRFNYTWNGENRLIKAEEQVCPTNRTLRKVEYAYDPQGRMVWKKISRGGAEAQSWEDEKATSYLWDSFNIIAETYVADSATNVTYNVWGLDIDGTLQGAGGVGGLLAVVSPLPLGESQGEGGTVYLPCYDANGNIMEYVSSDGTIAAHREYDPFGGTVVATGDVDVFTHWFSTKPWCLVTGLSEYQFRKYSPILGRWMSRDPIGEIYGINLYAYLENATVGGLDYLGLLDPKKVAQVLNKLLLCKKSNPTSYNWDAGIEFLMRKAYGRKWRKALVKISKQMVNTLDFVKKPPEKYEDVKKMLEQLYPDGLPFDTKGLLDADLSKIVTGLSEIQTSVDAIALLAQSNNDLSGAEAAEFLSSLFNFSKSFGSSGPISPFLNWYSDAISAAARGINEIEDACFDGDSENFVNANCICIDEIGGGEPGSWPVVLSYRGIINDLLRVLEGR